MRLNMPMPPSPAASLAAWQQSLVAALWAPTHHVALQRLSGMTAGVATRPSAHRRRGLVAYRSHAAAQAVRALAAAYPALARMLGEENLDALARELWREQPPLCGDLAQWGAALAGLIGRLPDLVAAEPYLADVARAEWALHQAAMAADAMADPPSYALLANADPAELRLALAPGTACIASAWPVVTLIQAHASEPPELGMAASRLAAGVAETALVWRQGFRPQLRIAHAGEAAFIAAVQQGLSLLDALAKAADFDFNAWLVPAVHDGLLLRVLALDNPEPVAGTTRRIP